jgi:hypothetical protein
VGLGHARTHLTRLTRRPPTGRSPLQWSGDRAIFSAGPGGASSASARFRFSAWYRNSISRRPVLFCNRPFISITQESGSNVHVQRCYANSRTWGARSIEPVGKTFLPLGDCSIAHARTVVTRVRRVGGRPRVSKVTENGTLNVPGSHAPASRYDVACRIVPRGRVRVP